MVDAPEIPPKISHVAALSSTGSSHLYFHFTLHGRRKEFGGFFSRSFFFCACVPVWLFKLKLSLVTIFTNRATQTSIAKETRCWRKCLNHPSFAPAAPCWCHRRADRGRCWHSSISSELLPSEPAGSPCFSPFGSKRERCSGSTAGRAQELRAGAALMLSPALRCASEKHVVCSRLSKVLCQKLSVISYNW